jgi:hypothetical protein
MLCCECTSQQICYQTRRTKGDNLFAQKLRIYQILVVLSKCAAWLLSQNVVKENCGFSDEFEIMSWWRNAVVSPYLNQPVICYGIQAAD